MTAAERLARLAAELVEVAAELARERERPVSEAPLDLITAGEAARVLAVPKARIYALAREGQAGAVRVGSRGVRFSKAALESWVARGGRI